jgi:short-subunit dehydrogenase
MSYLSKKVVWITGASSGIGEALVYELARKGARLIISARRKEELERVKGASNPNAHHDIRILPLDLSMPESLQLTTEAAIQFFGHIDIMIHCGGITQRSLAKDTSLDVDRRLMEVDYFGAIAITKHLLPYFLKWRSGHFVVVTSVMGIIGTPWRSGYAAAKHALHGFFDSLRAEHWKDRIEVTLICPGWIRTNLTLHALTGDGSALNTMDPSTDKGMSPREFARKAVRAIERRKEEVYIGGRREGMAILMKRFFPGWFSRIIRKAKVR